MTNVKLVNNITMIVLQKITIILPFLSVNNNSFWYDKPSTNCTNQQFIQQEATKLTANLQMSEIIPTVVPFKLTVFQFQMLELIKKQLRI